MKRTLAIVSLAYFAAAAWAWGDSYESYNKRYCLDIRSHWHAERQQCDANSRRQAAGSSMFWPLWLSYKLQHGEWSNGH